MNSDNFAAWCHALQLIEPGYQRKPLVMGVLNITPDSFSDGGLYLEQDSAYERAQHLIEQGADLIDIGGESSKPWAKSISIDEELSRVIPVIERIRATSDICISIDTCKAQVMHEAIGVGANFINDIKALTGEGSLSVAARFDVPVCLVHMQGEPASMQENPQYTEDVVADINAFFQARITACLQAGIARERIIIDPGFGFGKSVQHNLMLMNRLSTFQQHNVPLLIGVSRKSTIGAILKKAVSERLSGGLALAVFATLQGVAIIRTHDVDETNQALQMIDAICGVEI